MKIIFLDIDGVLNRFSEYTAPSVPTHEWNPTVMQRCGIALELFPRQIRRMNELVQSTGAKIVLTSSWRKGDDTWWLNLLRTLEESGLLPVVIDKTPDLRLNRGDEIQAWLDEHPEVTHFVIFDDIDEFPGFLDKFIQTDYRLGVQDTDIVRAKEILGL